MAGQTGPKRTPEERQADRIEAYGFHLMGWSLKSITEHMSKVRQYSLSETQIYNDIKDVGIGDFPSVMNLADRRFRSVLFFDAVANKALSSGGSGAPDIGALRIALDAKWKAYQITEAENERFMQTLRSIDPAKITQEWKDRLEALVNEVKN